MPNHLWVIDMLRKHVRRVVPAQNLAQFKMFGFDAVLDPSVCNRKVPALSKTAASACADRRGRISERDKVEREAQVLTKGAQPDGLAVPLADT